MRFDRYWLAGLACLVSITLVQADECLVLPAQPSAADLRAVYTQPRACWPAPNVEEGIQWQEMAPLPDVAFPADNPYSSAKAQLGMQLFFDPRLSASHQLACASCHDPHLGWADGRRVSFGHNRRAGERNAPSIINAGHLSLLFWDGRAASLEQQTLMSMTNPVEMNADLTEVVATLSGVPEYVASFESVFGKEIFGEHVIQPQTIAMAISTFVRTVTSRESRFERFMTGRHGLLNDQQLRGLHLFRTQAGCMNCHHGPLLTDGQFHNIGLHFIGRVGADEGRYLVTGKPADRGAFRTPGLRDVTFSGPWAHNGHALTLEGLLNIYNRGGARLREDHALMADPLYPRTSPLLKPLRLTGADIQALVAFLESMSQHPQPLSPPSLPDWQ